MGTVFAVAMSVMLTAGGAAVAAGGSFGIAGMGGLRLAGHVLLGLGVGHLAAVAVRLAARRIVKSVRSRPVAARVPAAPLPAVRLAPVAVLPARPAAAAPLRGRHAA